MNHISKELQRHGRLISKNSQEKKTKNQEGSHHEQGLSSSFDQQQEESQPKQVEESQAQDPQKERMLLLQERQTLKDSLVLEEFEYQEHYQRLVCKLNSVASPIDEMIYDLYPEIPSFSKPNRTAIGMTSSLTTSTPIDFTKNIGWKLSQSIMWTTIDWFSRSYDRIHILSRNENKQQQQHANRLKNSNLDPMKTPSSQKHSQKTKIKPTGITTTSKQSRVIENKDLMDAMWGTRVVDQRKKPIRTTPGIDGTIDDNDDDGQEQNDNDGSRWTIPSWIPFLATALPKKSIFGAKQLPQYSLLYQNQVEDEGGDGPELQLLALTSGTTWDARQVQQQVAQELEVFYESLLNVGGDSSGSGPDTNPSRVQLHSLPASQLALHEHSRIVLTIQEGRNMLQLGWVSNFGDAATRACDLIFKGGGRHDVKEYVFVVHASIMTPSTIQYILQANRPKEDQNVVQIPPIIQLCGQRRSQGESSGGDRTVLIPMDDLVKDSKENHGSVFAMRHQDTTTAAVTTTTTLQSPTRTRGQGFTLLEPQGQYHPIGRKLKTSEARACPFRLWNTTSTF